MTVLGSFVLNWKSLITFLGPFVDFLVFEILFWTQQIQSSQHNPKKALQPGSTSHHPRKRTNPALKIHYVFLEILCWEIRAPYQTVVVVPVHVFLHILKVEFHGLGHEYDCAQL